MANRLNLRLCPPVRYWDRDTDYLAAFLAAFLATMIHERARAEHPSLAAWAKSSRLNPTSGIAAYRDDPGVVQTRERIKRVAGAAASNLQKLLAGALSSPPGA